MKSNEENSVQYIDRRGLQTGYVSLIKIVGENAKLEKNSGVIGHIDGKKIVAINIRKIVFEENDGYGTDIFYKVSREQPYVYKIADIAKEDSISNYENNTLVIRHGRNLSDVLFFVGFPDKIDAGDVKEIKKVVMPKSEGLRIKSHKLRITGSGIIDPNRVRDINSQSLSLDNFIKTSLPECPQKIEKVYAKYFK